MRAALDGGSGSRARCLRRRGGNRRNRPAELSGPPSPGVVPTVELAATRAADGGGGFGGRALLVERGGGTARDGSGALLAPDVSDSGSFRPLRIDGLRSEHMEAAPLKGLTSALGRGLGGIGPGRGGLLTTALSESGCTLPCSEARADGTDSLGSSAGSAVGGDGASGGLLIVVVHAHPLKPVHGRMLVNIARGVPASSRCDPVSRPC